MNTLAPLFLIGSSSFMQVRRTCMKAWKALDEFEFWQICNRVTALG